MKIIPCKVLPPRSIAKLVQTTPISRWFIQGGTPPVMFVGLKFPMNYRYNSLINPRLIGLICTNLANELGHHLVGDISIVNGLYKAIYN